MSEPGQVTQLLKLWRQGDEAAASVLLPLIYGDLKMRAARYLRHERSDHTLQPTALVHEAYMRLVDQKGTHWQDRAHFFAIAAKMMRRVLLDHARKHLSGKRGGGMRPVELEVAEELPALSLPELVALDDALNALAAFDQNRATLIELRYFAGLTVEETAEVMGCSTATVMRQWRTARAWLFAELSGKQTAAAADP